MEKVTVAAGVPYEVLIGEGLLSRAGELAAKAVKGRRVMILTDDTVGPLYLAQAEEAFRGAGFAVSSFSFPEGEGYKTLDTVEKALEAADAAGLTRGDLFAALGGGLVGDVTGLAAALYLRGVDFVQLPTTLLAMVDASVGGKTAVNLRAGKNLCGAFHQPRLVVCDPETLKTLPPPVRAEGMAEVVKHGALGGEALLNRIIAGGSPTGLIAANVRFKSSVVSRDEKESGLRQLLNLGHTFGHAVEKLSGFTIYHGEGVSVGLMIAAFAAEAHGLCEKGVYTELRTLLRRENLPVTTSFTAKEIAAAAMNDKKRRGDRITLVLPEKRGSSRLYPLPAAELEGFIACCDGEVTDDCQWQESRQSASQSRQASSAVRSRADRDCGEVSGV